MQKSYQRAFFAAFLIAAGLPSNMGYAATQCKAVGGMVMTNMNVIEDRLNLGTATGDLKGAVAAGAHEQTENPDGTLTVKVQHYWVTDEGDTILTKIAVATTAPTQRKGLVSILNYPMEVTGGTGKFEGATGTVDVGMGQLDFESGRTVFRYRGRLCFKQGK